MNRTLTILKWSGIGLLSLLLVAIAMVYAVSEYRLTRTYDVPLTAIAVPHDAASIAEGKRLVGVYHCGSCHGEHYQGREFMKVDKVATLIAPNITLKIPTYSDPELARLVRHAIKRDGHNAWMFASGMYTPITDTDLGRMIGYLRTLTPVSGPDLGQNSLGPIGRALLLAGKFPIMAEAIDHKAVQTLGQDTTLLGRGKYLTMTACSGCHGGPALQGGQEGDMKSPALIIATSFTTCSTRARAIAKKIVA
jgi:mono/diheme cytochrome c family protein